MSSSTSIMKTRGRDGIISTIDHRGTSAIGDGDSLGDRRGAGIITTRGGLPGMIPGTIPGTVRGTDTDITDGMTRGIIRGTVIITGRGIPITIPDTETASLIRATVGREISCLAAGREIP